MSTSARLHVEALTRETFAPFGDVIEAAAAGTQYAVNTGTATRFHDLARIDTGSDGGRTVVSIFRSAPRALPFDITMLERHPLGSQAFVPLRPDARWIVVVASDPADTPRAFLAENGQGVNYRRGVWHHPLIALDAAIDFLCIDRAGMGENCDEVELAQGWVVELA